MVDAVSRNLSFGGRRVPASGGSLVVTQGRQSAPTQGEPVFRVLTVTALLGSLVLMTGCNREPANYEVFAQVTGADGTVVDTITITTPNKPASPVEGEDKKLPMKLGYVIESADAKKGDFTITAKPTKGALTCAIIVEKKEVKKVEGAVGEAVTCAAKVA
jgi:hypothetical protein